MLRTFNNLDLFHEFLLESINDSLEFTYPTHDIIETTEGYVVEVSLPGVNKNDINTEINKNELIITAEHKKNKDVKYLKQQIFKGKYELKFSLGDIIDKENIDAVYEDGILKVSVPKQQEKKKLTAKKIEIK
jgi:HSP20 family protein